MAPAAPSRVPSYRRHKATGQAVVTLSGRDCYLGKFNTQKSKAEYDRLIAEWIASGRQLPKSSKTDLRIVELVATYLDFAEGYYVKNGKPTDTIYGIKVVIGLLQRYYGHTRSADFGPLALKALQQRMIDEGHSRRYINDNVDRIRRIFKWAVSEELVSPSVYQGLQAVAGLRKGRTAARETTPIRPIDDATVDATIEFLPPIVADMVRLQRLTGCRPVELCILRPCDVDTSCDVWRYVPESHKTEHHGRERVIFIGPRAQDVVRPYLLREKTAFCFVPAESERRRNTERRENRKTPLTPCQASRHGKMHRKREPGQRYTMDSCRRAIDRAITRANEVRRKNTPDREDPVMLEPWAPNRLRHSAATEIRRRYGLETAQVTLGHATADVSQIYAERDMSKAAAVMREVG